MILLFVALVAIALGTFFLLGVIGDDIGSMF
jgi:hypothetical protein